MYGEPCLASPGCQDQLILSEAARIEYDERPSARRDYGANEKYRFIYKPTGDAADETGWRCPAADSHFKSSRSTCILIRLDTRSYMRMAFDSKRGSRMGLRCDSRHRRCSVFAEKLKEGVNG